MQSATLRARAPVTGHSALIGVNVLHFDSGACPLRNPAMLGLVAQHPVHLLVRLMLLTSQ